MCNCHFFTHKFTAGTCCFFSPKSIFSSLFILEMGKLVSSSKFPIGLMISGKSTRMNSWWFYVGVKATGSPKAKGRLFWGMPLPNGIPWCKNRHSKINFKSFSIVIPGGYHMGITVLNVKLTFTFNIKLWAIQQLGAT